MSPNGGNIVLDCLADAVIPALYLHTHISRWHSRALSEARQVKEQALAVSAGGEVGRGGPTWIGGKGSSHHH